MKVRKATAPKDSAKHMGHGICDNMTRSISLPAAISDAPAIKRYVWLLIDQIKVDYGDIRGVGMVKAHYWKVDVLHSFTAACTCYNIACASTHIQDELSALVESVSLAPRVY